MCDSNTPTQEFTVMVEGPVPTRDRRSARRYPCHAANSVVVRLPATGAKGDAWAFNLSETGIGLNLPYRLEPGTVLALHLRGRQAGALVTVPARVARVTAKEDGTWQIGCTFGRRLPSSRLEELL